MVNSEELATIWAAQIPERERSQIVENETCGQYVAPLDKITFYYLGETGSGK